MRRNFNWEILTLLLIILVQISVQARKQKTFVVTDIDDLKEFKKLLRTKTNVLVLFVNKPKEAQSVVDALHDAAEVMKGKATLVLLDCSSNEGKKLCKKLKVGSEKSHYLKHYKDGEFHKDYDRGETVASMTNFLRDPTGDLPWEEDPAATEVFHLADGDALNKFIKRGAAAYKKSMVMFYAPWCGYCKTLKPEYVQAAADLKGEALLAAIDVAKPGNSKIRQVYNITGFPTLLYYEKGQLKFPYNGENKRQAIVDFMRDPTSQMQQKKKEVVDESWSQDSDVVHLTGETFDSVLAKAEHALVVFYAPWCGHCKRIKPEFEKAATKIKTQKINGILAAVDATKEPSLASRFEVKGYPTLKYFRKGEYQYDAGHARQEDQIVSFIKINGILAAVDATKEPSLASRFEVKGYPTLKYFRKGEYQYDAGHARQEDQIVSFIKDPQEPPPPPPPEKPWSEEASSVRHLDAATFRNTLRKAKHALVMFYAPSCCKPHVSNRPWSEEASSVRHLDAATFRNTLRKAKHALVMFYAPSCCKPHVSNKPWSEEASSVRHLDAATFRNTLRKVKHALVMFYAPWCGHCKSTKPEFVRAAERFATELMVLFAAVDCTSHQQLCANYDVRGYPTIKYFSYFDKQVDDYNAGRKEADFVSYIHTQMEHETQAAEKTTKAKTSQEAGFGVNVRLATDDDFMTIIGAEKPTFVMFYASSIHSRTKTSQEAGFGVNVRLATDDDFMTIIGAEKPTFVMFYASCEFTSYCYI
ncbi:thioredoxin domain-containing protein [Phthorimaea operculella]|nr:thioredoxin domain-containing protein [Phthorimaea operculella]